MKIIQINSGNRRGDRREKRKQITDEKRKQRTDEKTKN